MDGEENVHSSLLHAPFGLQHREWYRQVPFLKREADLELFCDGFGWCAMST